MTVQCTPKGNTSLLKLLVYSLANLSGGNKNCMWVVFCYLLSWDVCKLAQGGVGLLDTLTLTLPFAGAAAWVTELPEMLL